MRNSRGGGGARVVPPAMPPPPPPLPTAMPVFAARTGGAGGICEQPNVLPSHGKIGGQLRGVAAAGGKEGVKKWTTREDPVAKQRAELEAQAGEVQRRAADEVQRARAEAVARLKVQAEQAEADGRAKRQVQLDGEARRRAAQEVCSRSGFVVEGSGLGVRVQGSGLKAECGGWRVKG